MTPFKYEIAEYLELRSLFTDADPEIYQVISRSHDYTTSTNYYQLLGSAGQSRHFSENTIDVLLITHKDTEPNPCQFGVHRLVDNTALRTWCADCNVDVEWSRDTNSFEITINNIKEII